MSSSMTAPDVDAAAQARHRLAALAIPTGALGRLGDLAVWVAATQGACPPRPMDRVRAVVFAGDHGVAHHGVSAYPAAVTVAMVRTMLEGRAVVCVLAAQHNVALRVLDVGVDADLRGVPDAVTRHRVRDGSRPIHLEDAVDADDVRVGLNLGAQVALAEIAAGAQLLVAGDLGIGNTTIAAALVAATLGLSAAEVAGRGTGVDDEGLARKVAVIQQALDRAAPRPDDPAGLLRALGSVDLAAQVGFFVQAARSGVPVLLDGVVSAACALLAEQMAPGAAEWFAAGLRSTEGAQHLALRALGLEPLLDLGLRVGEGSGAVAAVPLVRAATLLLSDVALLAEVVS